MMVNETYRGEYHARRMIRDHAGGYIESIPMPREIGMHGDAAIHYMNHMIEHHRRIAPAERARARAAVERTAAERRAQPQGSSAAKALGIGEG